MFLELTVVPEFKMQDEFKSIINFSNVVNLFAIKSATGLKTNDGNIVIVKESYEFIKTALEFHMVNTTGIKP